MHMRHVTLPAGTRLLAFTAKVLRPPSAIATAATAVAAPAAVMQGQQQRSVDIKDALDAREATSWLQHVARQLPFHLGTWGCDWDRLWNESKN